MNDFWNGKSLAEVTREYLLASAENLIDLQPMNAEGIVKYLCGNMTIRNNAQGFVADYFDDAIAAIREFNPDGQYRLSQYDKTANMMISKAAKELLEQCDTVKRHEGSYHIWKRADIEDLKEDLEDLSLSRVFQRAADVKFESLDSYSYRFLDYVLKEMVGKTVKLDELILELPLARLSDQDARSFIKGNFEESMRLLDEFRDSGYKINYTEPAEMIQSILFQQQKEILKDNPFLEDLITYDGVSVVKMDGEFIENLTDSLNTQRGNVRLSKFEEMTQSVKKNFVAQSGGKVIDLSRRPGRIEIIY